MILMDNLQASEEASVVNDTESFSTGRLFQALGTSALPKASTTKVSTSTNEH